MKKSLLTIICICFTFVFAHAEKTLTLTSPNGKVVCKVNINEKITYNVTQNGKVVLENSPISLTLSNGKVWGQNAKLRRAKQKEVNETITSPFYKKDKIDDHYKLLQMSFRGRWALEFRAYNDGVAYRFINKNKKPFEVITEQSDFNFNHDALCHAAYSTYGKKDDRPIEEQFFSGHENHYSVKKLSELNPKRLIMLPMVVQANEDTKICINESGLEKYPGMYVLANNKNQLTTVHAPYPKRCEQGGYNMYQSLVKERENFIAKINGYQEFPWRSMIIANNDIELANSDMTYKLAQPSKIEDYSWINAGKVAWDWWNDWNLEGVDFKTGVNNNTYKYYIDFASKNNIRYVLLDEGWATKGKGDLFDIVKDIDIKELVDYGKERNVEICLWAGWYPFYQDMEKVCKYYSELGVKGFKVDFMSRDDQPVVEFTHEAAAMCAKYNLILDLHGMFNPAGLNRTYPNVLNFEGVFGLEQMRWAPITVDQVTYDVTIPFIRQVSGPIDYTQGAMINGTKESYHPSSTEPMSQGTRCRQLAMYTIFESPFNMLCDSPTNYEKEPECLAYIADIPTVWDETINLQGEISKYIITARRSNNTWYIGGMTNWDARDLKVDLSFLNMKEGKIILYKDGINADRKASDYKKVVLDLKENQMLNIHLAPGGGFAIKIEK